MPMGVKPTRNSHSVKWRGNRGKKENLGKNKEYKEVIMENGGEKKRRIQVGSTWVVNARKVKSTIGFQANAVFNKKKRLHVSSYKIFFKRFLKNLPFLLMYVIFIQFDWSNFIY